MNSKIIFNEAPVDPFLFQEYLNAEAALAQYQKDVKNGIARYSTTAEMLLTVRVADTRNALVAKSIMRNNQK